MWLEIIAGICLAWYVFIAIVCSIGYIQLVRHYRSVPRKPVSSSLADSPHVTVIRPTKGLEPYLYDCLAATFHQDYPIDKLTIYFCISSRDDPAFPILQQLLQEFPTFDAKIFVEAEDPLLAEDGPSKITLGPNPKVRNMSRGYREARGDLIWIIDCNIWVGRGACGRMVDKICGLSDQGQSKPYKFVHHLPICVDVEGTSLEQEAQSLLNGHVDGSKERQPPTQEPSLIDRTRTSRMGGRLEEVFLSSSHAKFYTSINTVAIAPCIVGKSNMFRRSHLNHLTSPSSTLFQASTDPATSTPTSPPPPPLAPQEPAGIGIDHFSYNICEDHLIGDLLWRSPLPPLNSNSTSTSRPLLNHALILSDLAIQPMTSMTVQSYAARRIRWLRVRKFTVPLATLVEPGTESFLCSAYGAFAITTLPAFHERLAIPQTWRTFAAFWLLSIMIWMLVDWTVYLLLHSGRTIETDHPSPIPPFAKPLPRRRLSRRPSHHWLLAWLGREALAFPIWFWAFWGGTTVIWRDRKFWVGMDMKVHAVDDWRTQDERKSVGEAAVKARRD